MARINLNEVKHLLSKDVTIDKDNALLLVVDMINGFCNTSPYGKEQKIPALADNNIMDIVPTIEKDINFIGPKKTIFIADYHEQNAVELKTFPAHCNNIHESLVVQPLSKYVIGPKNLILKNSTNAFNAFLKIPSLMEKLRETKQIILEGCCTDICILTVALALKTYFNENSNDIEIIIVVDGVDTYNIPQIHEASYFNKIGLELMALQGIKIIEKIKYEEEN